MLIRLIVYDKPNNTPYASPHRHAILICSRVWRSRQYCRQTLTKCLLTSGPTRHSVPSWRYGLGGWWLLPAKNIRFLLPNHEACKEPNRAFFSILPSLTTYTFYKDRKYFRPWAFPEPPAHSWKSKSLLCFWLILRLFAFFHTVGPHLTALSVCQCKKAVRPVSSERLHSGYSVTLKIFDFVALVPEASSAYFQKKRIIWTSK